MSLLFKYMYYVCRQDGSITLHLNLSQKSIYFAEYSRCTHP